IMATTFNPQTDAPTADLLNHQFSVTQGGIAIKQGLTNGSYQVYTYHMENNASYSRSFNIAVQGQVVTSSPVSLAQYQWVKMGPYAANVTNGVREIDLQQVSGDASIMGLEILSSSGGQVANLPAPTPPPTPPPGTAQPYGVSGNFTLTFDDEFSGTSVNTANW